MKPTGLFLLLWSCIFGLGFGHPDHEHRVAPLEQRQAALVITTGAPGPDIHPRLEIRQMLHQQPNQWTLFILAMRAFQNQSQSLATSYYQVAGIHGVPRQDYNGVGQCSTCGGTDGYCTHDMVLFPAWHRTYMALFEQQFIATVNTIVAQYNGSQRITMQNAAASIRFPYWDWAANPPPGLPTLVNVMTDVLVTLNNAPTGQVTIRNPLYRHDFASTSDMFYYPFDQWPSTYRYPSTDAASAFSQESLAVTALNQVRPSLQDQVYQLMTTCTDYLHFSNDDAGSSTTSCSNSLEGIHNTVHTQIGGGGNSSVAGGHMYYLATAAFDPAFWLHHCNVDRLFTFWQVVNPGSYGASQSAPHPTWTIASGSELTADSPLTPFYKDDLGNFWTTNEVASWNTTFHYTYPEFSDSDGSQRAIISYVNELYGPSATATAGSSKRTAAPEPRAAGAADVTSLPRDPRSAGTLIAASNGSLYQYVANIVTPRYALNGTYNIYLFNGNPASEEPSAWLYDSNFIGPMGVLAQPGMADDTTLASGSVPLTRTLTQVLGAGGISGLSQEFVVPYLKANLAWRIVNSNSTSVDPGSINGFEISVAASTSTQPESMYTLPVYSPFVALAEITDGQSGGLNTTDTDTGGL